MALELAWTSFPSSPYLCYPLSPLSVVESSSASSVPSSFHMSWIWKAKGPGPRDSSTHNGVRLRGCDTAVQMCCIFSDSSWTQIRTMEVREVAVRFSLFFVYHSQTDSDIAVLHNLWVDKIHFDASLPQSQTPSSTEVRSPYSYFVSCTYTL